MPDRQVSDDVREAFARLTGNLEDASAIAAEAQGALQPTDAKASCSQLAKALRAMLEDVEAIRERIK